MAAPPSEKPSSSTESKKPLVPVLLVEDDAEWRKAIETLLEPHPYFQLVASVDCFEDALDAFDAHHPQMALLDWQIAGKQDGLAVGKALMERGLDAHTMIVVSGSPPASIPTHPFRFVAKSRIACDLLQVMDECLLEMNR